MDLHIKSTLRRNDILQVSTIKKKNRDQNVAAANALQILLDCRNFFAYDR